MPKHLGMSVVKVIITGLLYISRSSVIQKIHAGKCDNRKQTKISSFAGYVVDFLLKNEIQYTINAF